jgi:hypothetical protein
VSRAAVFRRAFAEGPPMKSIRQLFFLAALCGLCFHATDAASARPVFRGFVQGKQKAARKYKIYCIGGVVQIENLTADEIERDRKVKPCELARTEFDNLSLARKAAKRFGGAGAPCRCTAVTSQTRR